MPALVLAIHAFDNNKKRDVDARDIGERSDAVLRTAMRGHGESNITSVGISASPISPGDNGFGRRLVPSRSES